MGAGRQEIVLAELGKGLWAALLKIGAPHGSERLPPVTTLRIRLGFVGDNAELVDSPPGGADWQHELKQIHYWLSCSFFRSFPPAFCQVL